MRVFLLLVCALALLFTLANARLHPRPSTPVHAPRSHHSIHSTPVFLNDFSTPETAQAATRVHLPGLSADTFAGYATVTASCGSNLFWWFFPAQDGNSSSPLLMWLNGGPGSSSMYGLFEEMG